MLRVVPVATGVSSMAYRKGDRAMDWQQLLV